MYTHGKEALLLIAESALPGLVHFGVTPLSLYPEKALKRIKVFIPGREFLNLKSLSLVGQSPPIQAEAVKASMSSMHKSSAQPIQFMMEGRGIHTESESEPFWQAVFAAPQTALRIDITNRLGTWGIRSYGICVELEYADKTVQLYDNLAISRLVGYLDAIEICFNSINDAVLAQKIVAPEQVLALANCRARISSLLRKTHSAVMGENVPPTDLVDLRMQAGMSLVGLYELLTGKTLRDALSAGKKLINSLLWKGKKSIERNYASHEFGLLCLAFSADIEKSKGVSLDMIAESDQFLTTSDDVAAIELGVNNIIRRAEITNLNLPLMFRTHGMRGAPLLSDISSHVESLAQVEVLLAELGFQSCICYGTFLGAVREKGFIPHDDDVDMAVVLENSKDWKQSLTDIVVALKAKGVNADFCRGHSFLKIQSPDHKRFVDVFPIIPVDGDTVEMYMEQLKIRKVPRNVVLPLAKVELYGRTFNCPAAVDGFLTERYGASWTTPQRLIGSRWMPVHPVKVDETQGMPK